MRYEGSSGLSTPPESPTSTNNFRRFLPSRSPSIASQQSAKQPRLSRRAAFLRVNKPHIDLRLFDDSAYHSLPASPSLYSATPRTYEALPLILPLSPPLCAHDLFEKALAKSASCQTLGPKSAPKLQHPDADRYSLTSPSPVQFGEDFFSGARTTELGTTENKDSGTCSVSCDEMPLNSPLPEVLAMSLDHYHDSTDTALCHAIEESSDNRQNIRLSPGSFPPIDDDCEDLWDPAEMPITSGWIDDSSDEEDDAPDYEEERSAQRKWQIVQHSPDDNLPFEFESTEEAFVSIVGDFLLFACADTNCRDTRLCSQRRSRDSSLFLRQIKSPSDSVTMSASKSPQGQLHHFSNIARSLHSVRKHQRRGQTAVLPQA